MAPGSLNSVVAVGFPERQIYSTFLLLIPLLLWRLWKFTLLPALRPSDPKEVPYWIPCQSTVHSCRFALLSAYCEL